MTSHGGVGTLRRKDRRAPSAIKKSAPAENGSGRSASEVEATSNGTLPKLSSPSLVSEERTVKKLRLSKALTIPEGTTVSDACRRMSVRKVDAVLLTDSSGLLSGIVTDKDITTRVIAEGLRPEQTIVSKVMTRNPQYVMADTLAIEALQKMVQGKFSHLPVVDNGEVISMLDITKCLYDAILRLEKAAEQGSAIAAAVEGVERQWGSNFSGNLAIAETLRDKLFKPSLSTIITENTKVAVVSPADPVYLATKRMREFRLNSVIVVSGGKPHGILTSRDVLMRVVAHNLSPELTQVEKVMTPNPECATIDTTILDALHIMHNKKILHVPVVDRDEKIIACLDVLQLTHAAISLVEEGSDTANDMANTLMQKFWDSALNLEPADEDFETNSEVSAFEVAESGRSMYPPVVGNAFSFKFKDHNGHVHRFNCGTESLTELVSTLFLRVGLDRDKDHIKLLYEDDEGDRVLLATDYDLIHAVNNARLEGAKVLKLYIDDSETNKETNKEETRMVPDFAEVQRSGWTLMHSGILAGTVVLVGVGVMLYLKRSKV